MYELKTQSIDAMIQDIHTDTVLYSNDIYQT
jgi:hypothetical protein